ncbi:MAG: hypothetical protein DMF11_01795 [Verrucomicrobia bacterium]|nr:MAG: hypothetical protein DMF11_01795 [Verrucomicrobiota bacterium]
MIGSVICSVTSSAELEDSVSQLARALADLSADSSVVDLPEGLYTIGSTWVISRPGVTIRGAGLGKTILVRNPKFDGVLVRMNAENGTITNLTIDGNGAATVISLDRPGVTADTIEVKNFTHIGIAVPASGGRITKCLVNGFGTAEAPSMGIWHDAGKIPTKSTITIDHSTIQNNGMCGIYCTGGEVIVTNNRISGNHIITSPGGGQIDIGNAKFTVTKNTIRNHGASGVGLGHNAIQAVIANNTISNCGQNIGDGNKPPNRSGIYVLSGATNVEISDNRCFDDQPNKTQTWGIILASPLVRSDASFAARHTEHVTIKQNDLRGNIHPEGLLDESGARDRITAGNLPARANR